MSRGVERLGGAPSCPPGCREEALYLRRVQVHGQHAVGAGLDDQVGHQLGADRRARRGLPVLPRIAEIPESPPSPAVPTTRRSASSVISNSIRLSLAGNDVEHHEHVFAADDLSWISTNTSMSAKRRIEALVNGRFNVQATASVSGQLLGVAGDDFHAAGPVRLVIGPAARRNAGLLPPVSPAVHEPPHFVRRAAGLTPVAGLRPVACLVPVAGPCRVASGA